MGEGFQEGNHESSEEEHQHRAEEGQAEEHNALPVFFEDVDVYEVNSDSESEFSDEDDVMIDNVLRANDADSDKNDESSIDSSDDDRNVERVPVFKFLFRQWALTWGICFNALDALLYIFRLFPWGADFPKSARTLLQTPRSVVVRKVAPGEYLHFGILNGIKDFLKTNVCKDIPDVIEIAVGADGLPIAKSSGRQFWSIVGLISLPGVEPYPFTIGLYEGLQKPASFNDFYMDFVNEAMDLFRNGFEWLGIKKTVKVVRFVFDAPARASSLYIKSHSGYYGCGKCVQKGGYTDHVIFPQRDAELRNNQSFRAKRQQEHHTGTSILEQLNIDMVADVPVDPMHLLYLGVMRQILSLWVRGPLRTRLGLHQRNSISDRLSSFEKWIPREFARKPRSLQFLDRFKATELRQILLYTGVVAFRGIISKKMYANFISLHVAARILSHRDLCISLNRFAERTLIFFVKKFRKIYGKTNLSYNVHNLVHIAKECLKWGYLDGFSAFPFENYMQFFKKLLRKFCRPLKQVAKRIAELSKARVIKVKISPSQQARSFINQHYDGDMIDGLQGGKQFQTVKIGKWFISTKTACDCCIYTSDGHIVLVKNFVRKGGIDYIIGRNFVKKEDLYTYQKKSSELDIYVVCELSRLKSWSFDKFKCKALRLPLEKEVNDETTGFATFSLLMNETF